MKDKVPILKLIARGGLAFIIGLVNAVAISYYILKLFEYSPIEQLFLVIVPSIALGYLFFQINNWVLNGLRNAKSRIRIIIIGLSILTASFLVAAGDHTSFGMAIVTFLSGITISLIFLLPTAYAMDLIIAQKNLPILALASIFSSIFGYFLINALSNFQIGMFEFALLALFLNLGMGLFFYHLFIQWKRGFLEADKKIGSEIFIVLLLFLFTLALSLICYHFLDTINPYNQILNRSIGYASLVLFTFTGPWLAWLYSFLNQHDCCVFLRKSRAIVFLKENYIGLITAGLFFVSYFMLSNIFNLAIFNGDDMFFDTDATTWRVRLTTSMWEDPYWRSIHPLALLILRPAVSILGYLLHGNFLPAVLIVVAATGAACVFLIWFLTKNIAQNKPYALIVASLFGLSTTQLMFGALVETYIFSALLLIIFILVIQSKKTPMWSLTFLSVLTMGLTLTNLVQNMIALFIFRPNLKIFFRYISLVVSLVVVLSIMNSIIYPNANPLFFIPANISSEEKNLHNVSVYRAVLTVRELFIYSEVAPNTIVLTDRTRYPRFWFYTQIMGPGKKITNSFSEFDNLLGTISAYSWAVLISISAIFFIRKLYQKTHMTRTLLVLVLILAFNLFFHLLYGSELFLYTPHLFYALILFVFLTLADLVRYRWYLPALTMFLMLIMANNFYFVYSIINILLASVMRPG